MAISKVALVASLFVSLLVLSHLVEANETMMTRNIEAKAQKIDCGGACNVRCSLSSRPHLCKRACGTCCGRCSCVPPGTSGNHQACPCYASLTTHGGKPKCP